MEDPIRLDRLKGELRDCEMSSESTEAPRVAAECFVGRPRTQRRQRRRNTRASYTLKKLPIVSNHMPGPSNQSRTTMTIGRGGSRVLPLILRSLLLAASLTLLVAPHNQYLHHATCLQLGLRNQRAPATTIRQLLQLQPGAVSATAPKDQEKSANSRGQSAREGANRRDSDEKREFAYTPLEGDDHGDDSLGELTILAEEEGAGLAGASLHSLPVGASDYRVFYPRRMRMRKGRHTAAPKMLGGSKATGQAAHYNRTSVVIKAFNYKLRLELELNDILFGPNLVQKHFIPKGTHISSHQLDNCYYHAKSAAPAAQEDATTDGETPTSNFGQQAVAAIGAFRTCNGLSGIIHVNNESLVIHPFYNSDQVKNKQPHIIYRYQTGGIGNSGRPHDNEDNDNNGRSTGTAAGTTVGECGNSRSPTDWTLRQYDNRPSAINTPQAPTRRKRSLYESEKFDRQTKTMTGHLLGKRDVSLVEKYIELGLVLSKDMFTKRNASSRLEVLHDAIQIINCLDLYYRRATNTRIGLVYIETWAQGDQIEISEDARQTLYNFLDYSTRHLYGTAKDAVHLITGGHAQRFDSNSFGMSIPDSICTAKAVSVSQEASVLEPFITAASIAHLLGHNLGMEHDEPLAQSSQKTPPQAANVLSQSYFAPLASGGPPQGAQALNSNKISMPQETAVLRKAATTTSAPPDPASDPEDHEDELGGRSLTWLGNVEETAPLVNDSSDSLFSQEQADLADGSCRANCIMSERFVYSQPPVALGNMVVATNSPSSSPQADLNGPQFSIQQQQQEGSLLGTGQLNQQQSTIDLEIQQQQQVPNDRDERTALGQAPSLPFKFSRRSVETYFNQLRERRAMCLWNKPNKLETSIVATCGNGIVERDEDCDCGSRSDCWLDTCCERLTCKFRKGVECISGACCDRCQFRPRGFVCRKARAECDLPEVCDGNNYSCGPDLFKQNGIPCANSTGYCYMGQCPQHDLQCADLWGASGRSSDPLCYATMNTNGSIFGNCARPGRVGASARPSNANSQQLSSGASQKLKRCEPEHALCGTLQCQLGDAKPITAELELNAPNHHSNNNSHQRFLATTSSSSGENVHKQAAGTSYEFSRKVLRQNGRDHECKVITRPVSSVGGQRAARWAPNQKQTQQALASSSISYVRDGSKCGDQRVCFNQTCQPLERVYADAFSQCPRNERGQFCSNHGICSTANRCVCDDGWTGQDCSQSWPATNSGALGPAPAELVLDTRPMSLGGSVASNSLPISKNSDHSSGRGPTSGLQGVGHFIVAPPVSQQQPTTSPILVAKGSHEQLTTTMTSSSLPPVETTTSESISTTTSAPIAQQQQQPTPAQQATSNRQQVQDKKRQDALSAQQLVLILVTIVATVYLGFAAMANCYRRKNFIKPDKVLRHHQLNCKMESLRKSLIEKRLAQADANGFLPPPAPGDGSGHGTGSLFDVTGSAAVGGSGAPPADLFNPFLFSHSGSIAIPAHEIGQYMQQAHQHLQPAAPVQQTSLQAQVHYFDHEHQRQQPQQFGGGETAAQALAYSTADGNDVGGGSGDHIPLLMASELPPLGPIQNLQQQQRRYFARDQQPLRSFNVQQMRGFGGPRPLFSGRPGARNLPGSQQQQQLIYTQASQHDGSKNARGAPPAGWTTMRTNLRSEGRPQPAEPALMNRAVSLGNVHRQQQQRQASQQPDNQLLSFQTSRDDTSRRLMHHGALATPSRASRPNSLKFKRQMSAGRGFSRNMDADDFEDNDDELMFTHQGIEFDSLSAPSSPERLDAIYWGERTRLSNSNGDRRGRSRSRHASRQQQRQLSGEQLPMSQEHSAQPSPAEMSPVSSQSRSPQSTSPLPPPPPPPTQPSSELPRADGDVNERDGAMQQRQLRARRTVADNEHCEQDARQPPRPAVAASIQEHHLSLIAQLQQLEQVQSLHQQKRAAGAGLHEFFSLPLSVQLSALLARNLSEPATMSSQQAPATSSLGLAGLPSPAHIDEYLNTLNSSNVAVSSRRSFKTVAPSSGRGTGGNKLLAATGEQAPGSRGGTMRKQQAKLQNLQSLISRLQKLHNQTMQQQFDDLNDSNYDDYGEDGRNSGEEEALAALSAVELRASLSKQLGSQQARRAYVTTAGIQRVAQPVSQQRATNTAADEDALGRNISTRQQQIYESGARSRRALNMRRSDSQRAHEVASASYATSGKNELVYSMSDSEDGGCAYVNNMLTRTAAKGATSRRAHAGGLTPRMPSRRSSNAVARGRETSEAIRGVVDDERPTQTDQDHTIGDRRRQEDVLSSLDGEESPAVSAPPSLVSQSPDTDISVAVTIDPQAAEPGHQISDRPIC